MPESQGEDPGNGNGQIQPCRYQGLFLGKVTGNMDIFLFDNEKPAQLGLQAGNGSAGLSVVESQVSRITACQHHMQLQHIDPQFSAEVRQKIQHDPNQRHKIAEAAAFFLLGRGTSLLCGFFRFRFFFFLLLGLILLLCGIHPETDRPDDHLHRCAAAVGKGIAFPG